MRADVDVSQLSAIIKRYEAQGRNVRTILPAVEEALITAMDDVLEAEGPGWEPLSDVTLMRRRKSGAGAKILQDTGVMAASRDTLVGADFVEAFFAAEYAGYHVTGTSRMPRRDPTDLGPFREPLLDDIADMMVQEMMR